MLKCPNDFTVDFGRKLIKYLDPTADISIIEDRWCWRKFGKQFKYLESKVMEYFEQVKEGNPSLAVYNLVYYCGFNIKWAEDIIVNCKIGNPSFAAYLMVVYCGSDKKWAENIISNSKIANPSYIAYLMVKYCNSDRKWAENIIGKCKIGDPLYAANLMVRYYNSDINTIFN